MSDGPSPYELWKQAGGETDAFDKQQYRHLLVEHGHLRPLCRSHDGPYDDDAFVAGYQAGRIDAALAATAAVGADRVVAMVHTPLMKQLDLIGMHYGFTMTAAEVEETDEYPAMPEWSRVTFTRETG